MNFDRRILKIIMCVCFIAIITYSIPTVKRTGDPFVNDIKSIEK